MGSNPLCKYLSKRTMTLLAYCPLLLLDVQNVDLFFRHYFLISCRSRILVLVEVMCIPHVSDSRMFIVTIVTTLFD